MPTGGQTDTDELNFIFEKLNSNRPVVFERHCDFLFGIIVIEFAQIPTIPETCSIEEPHFVNINCYG